MVVQLAVDGDAFVVDDVARCGGDQVRRQVDVHHLRVWHTRAVLANNLGCRDTPSSSPATSIPSRRCVPTLGFFGGKVVVFMLFLRYRGGEPPSIVNTARALTNHRADAAVAHTTMLSLTYE